MPKTKDAFAFRDFDHERILQRPYFKQLNLPIHKTDEEIITSLQPPEYETSAQMETKLLLLTKLSYMVNEFHHLINNHLMKYFKIYKRPFSRDNYEKAYHIAYEIPTDFDVLGEKPEPTYLHVYGVVAMVISNLRNNLDYICRNVNDMIQQRYREELADRLNRYRKKARLTQKELGELVYVSQRGISHYLSGDRDMPIHTLIRLSKILGISADVLLGLK